MADERSLGAWKECWQNLMFAPDQGGDARVHTRQGSNGSSRGKASLVSYTSSGRRRFVWLGGVDLGKAMGSWGVSGDG